MSMSCLPHTLLCVRCCAALSSTSNVWAGMTKVVRCVRMIRPAMSILYCARRFPPCALGHGPVQQEPPVSYILIRSRTGRSLMKNRSRSLCFNDHCIVQYCIYEYVLYCMHVVCAMLGTRLSYSLLHIAPVPV